MSITEQQRHHLFTWFEEAMGSERAAVMMDLLPPVGWADVASKHDLLELERRLDLRFETLEHKMASGTDRAILRSTRTYVTWLLASQSAVIAMIAVAAGFLDFG